MELLGRVMADFRRRMWPLLALTALDALRVHMNSWAIAAGPPAQEFICTIIANLCYTQSGLERAP
jgi:hypothetical protein